MARRQFRDILRNALDELGSVNRLCKIEMMLLQSVACHLPGVTCRLSY